MWLKLDLLVLGLVCLSCLAGFVLTIIGEFRAALILLMVLCLIMHFRQKVQP